MRVSDDIFIIQDRIIVEKGDDVMLAIKNALSIRKYNIAGNIITNTCIPQPWKDRIWVQYVVEVKKR